MSNLSTFDLFNAQYIRIERAKSVLTLMDNYLSYSDLPNTISPVANGLETAIELLEAVLKNHEDLEIASRKLERRLNDSSDLASPE